MDRAVQLTRYQRITPERLAELSGLEESVIRSLIMARLIDFKRGQISKRDCKRVLRATERGVTAEEIFRSWRAVPWRSR